MTDQPISSTPSLETLPEQSPESFESALKTLENIVQKMEQGELSLDESLQHFEQGVQLTRYCQTILHDAEQRISTLMNDGTKDVYSPPSHR
ncbi:MAG TPA: exodeoxyribonuclease VII small subunit [Thiothrix sp.]|nr:exodeoxyribonuclease VII small subunit [Thiothrix sp.]